MSEPTVFLDVELTFLNGLKEYATLQVGRDTYDGLFKEDDPSVRLVIHHEDALETITATRPLACIKTARREVTPEPTFEDGGTTKVEP